MSDDDVNIKKTVQVKFLRKTAEVDGPRGWAEGSPMWVSVERSHHDRGGLLLTINNETVYCLSPDVVEALYDVHQDVPR